MEEHPFDMWVFGKGEGAMWKQKKRVLKFPIRLLHSSPKLPPSLSLEDKEK